MQPLPLHGRLLTAALLLGLALGCGKVGPPVPPPPRGPSAPVEVRARQVGENLFVEYRVAPARGTQPGQVPAEAEIIRVAFGAGVEPATDADVFRRRGETVAIRDLSDGAEGRRRRDIDPTLSLLELGGTGSTLRYAVRIRDARGRQSPLVATPELEMLPNRTAPTGLKAVPTPEGVELNWNSKSDAEWGYRIYRSPADLSTDPVLVGTAASDATGFADPNVELGQSYRYFMRTLLAEDAPIREGSDGPSVTVTSVDRFPPMIPTGLVGVQEGTSVRLFWNPNSEADLAGYRIYRRPEGGAWRELSGGQTESPTWRDRNVAVGDRLEYRVAAIDKTQPPNESDPTSAVLVDVIAEPVAGETPVTPQPDEDKR